MKRLGCLALVLAFAASVASAQVRQDDYLTPAEVEKVRDTQEPNQRARLFLQFARQRLSTFEEAFFTPPDQQPVHPAELLARLNDFISALDDTAATLEVVLERGGVDLHPARDRLAKTGQDFLARLRKLQQAEHPAKEELRWDLEDAVMALEDLLALGKQIPDGPIPPRAPAATADQQGTPPPPGPPGRPTLKRKDEKKDDDRR